LLCKELGYIRRLILYKLFGVVDLFLHARVIPHRSDRLFHLLVSRPPRTSTEDIADSEADR